ncbi:lipopolysaccharide kinase InaA family protein [Sulfurimonas sp.]|uniref:lipopolysaccharide kinase InaA family protein n=1 Tax=Sulfurimonas sp. TaxID=2022749 RepID=UPI0025DB78C8|nr:lipopolysaccharide kinase InaA family protein [Sulfurimonas sp.]MDD5156438.1 lipopolysaccharide kinase InaA family protein [Sulfurimonas sp.]
MKLESVDTNSKLLLKNIKKHFKNSDNSIHKARNEIKVINFENKELIIKSFKIPNIINKIVYSFFKDSKAKKSYDNSLKIVDFVPKPIGFIEFKKFGLINESYFVSEKFGYDFTIREPLLDRGFSDREAIFMAFAKFTFLLHESNIFHLDYSPGNILIKKESDTYTFKIVDINRMQFKTLTSNERLKNFSKLWAKDDDLRFIAKEYARLAGLDTQDCIEVALKYSQTHKNKINTKKRLRGIEVVD